MKVLEMAGPGACDGIETRYARRRGDPVVAVMCLHDILCLAVRQAVARREISEAIAIEDRDSFRRAEPQESSGIAADAGDPIAHQPVLGGKQAQRRRARMESAGK